MTSKPDTRRYRVRSGFDHINGQPTPRNRIVYLTDAEAQFDLGLGRIEHGGRPRDSSEATVPDDG